MRVSVYFCVLCVCAREFVDACLHVFVGWEYVAICVGYFGAFGLELSLYLDKVHGEQEQGSDMVGLDMRHYC